MFTFVYIGVLQGHILIVAHFYIFLMVFGTFLITDYLFCDLLLGSVFSTNNYNNLHLKKSMKCRYLHHNEKNCRTRQFFFGKF